MATLARSRALKRLSKKANKFRGFPIATIAYYGPDDTRASKVAVGIILRENDEAADIRRWFSETSDVRADIGIAEDILAYIAEWDVRSLSVGSRMLGCPHEEGVDYDGPICPQCPFWAGRNRWTGEMER